MSPSGVELVRLGQWEVDGPALGDGIFTETDGMRHFFHSLVPADDPRNPGLLCDKP